MNTKDYIERHPHAFQHDPRGPTGSCGYSHDASTGLWCGHSAEHHRWPCSPTCTHDDAKTPGHPERVKGRSEAFWSAMHPNGACECCGEGLCSWCRQAEAAAQFTDGAEAMRVACWGAVQNVAQGHGVGWNSGLWKALKEAIESATP